MYQDSFIASRQFLPRLYFVYLNLLNLWILVLCQDISHDAAVNEAVPRDPLHKDKGTLRGLTDMFNVVSSDTRRRSIPLLMSDASLLFPCTGRAAFVVRI